MEIRNFKLLCEGNKIASFDVYVPKYKGTFQGLNLVKGQKGTFVSLPSRHQKNDDGETFWVKCFEPDKEIALDFFAQIKSCLKEYMNNHNHGMHADG